MILLPRGRCWAPPDPPEGDGLGQEDGRAVGR